MCVIYDLQNSQKRDAHAQVRAGVPAHPMQALFRSSRFIHDYAAHLELEISASKVVQGCLRQTHSPSEGPLDIRYVCSILILHVFLDCP